MAELEYALLSKRSVLVTCRFDYDRAHHFDEQASVAELCFHLPSPTTFAPVAKLEDALHLKRSDRRLCRFDSGQGERRCLFEDT